MASPSQASSRIKGIKPYFASTVSARTGSLTASTLATTIFWSWSYVLYRLSAYLETLADLPSVEEGFLRTMASYTTFCSLSNLAIGCISAFTIIGTVSAHPSGMKHISRVIWIAYAYAWSISIVGVVAFVLDESWLLAHCVTQTDNGVVCNSKSWSGAQSYLLMSIAFTLFLTFYIGVTISAYAHSLHPEVFYFHSDDYDDSDSDYDFFEDSSNTTEPILPVFAKRLSPSGDRVVGGEDEGEDEDEKQGLIFLNEGKKSGRGSTRSRGFIVHSI